MLKKNALDLVLAKLDEEFSTQILQLEELAEMVGEVLNAKAKKRLEQLQKMRDKVIEQSVDDDMEIINPDIEEACSFLENESLPDPEDIVETLKERLEEEIDGLKNRYETLQEIRKATPREAFFVVEQDDDDDDDEDGDDDDDPSEMEQKVLNAIAELNDGDPSLRVRLADLRIALWRIPRPELDAVLTSMSAVGRIALFPEDSPRSRTEEDDEAALLLSGVPQHYVYLG